MSIRRRLRATRNVGVGALAVVGLIVGISAPVAAAETDSGATNLALAGSASQSSTWSGLSSATADKAIDGNTDGKLENGSVTHTDVSVNPWWQVDLGATHSISAIQVFNRSDCCQDRLGGATVFVSQKPFDTALDPAARAKQPGVTAYSLPAGAWSSQNVPVDASGRYVMVQQSGWSLFSLAEVKVLGGAAADGQGDPAPAVAGVTFTQIIAGVASTLAIGSDRATYAWGANF